MSLPTRAEIREQLKNLPPERREAKINELRREFGSASAALPGRRSYGAMNGDMRQRMERMRREFQNLSPEERQARLSEMRRRGGAMQPGQTRSQEEAAFSKLTPSQREEFLKLRRQLADLPEKERLAKFREFFKKAGVAISGLDKQGKGNSGGDPRQQFQQMREQLQARVKELEREQADGSITEQESRQLERIKQLGGKGRQGGRGNRRPRN